MGNLQRGGSTKGRHFPAEPMSSVEIRGLLDACAKSDLGTRNRMILFLLWRCALRISELLALRPCDVDVAGGTVRVLRGKRSRARTVGLDGEAGAAVAAWIDVRRRRGIDGPLVSDLRGVAIGANAVREVLTRLRSKIGLAKRCNPHSFRATWASKAARQIPLIDVMVSLGHSDLAVTTRYVSALGGVAVDSARRINFDD